MNVVVTYGNGETINPVYAPGHEESVIAFYHDLVNRHLAMSVVITMDSGEVVRIVEA